MRSLQLLLCAAAALHAQAPAADTSQSEEALASAYAKEPDLGKKLSILDNWRAAYPTSKFGEQREMYYLAVYDALGRAADVEGAARRLAAFGTISSEYNLVVLAPDIKQPTPGLVELVKTSSQDLLARAVGPKPEGISDAQWQQMKPELQTRAYNGLGWRALQQHDFRSAEQVFVYSLELNAAQGMVSLELAISINGQQRPDRVSEVIYHTARAAYYEGTGALAPEIRTALRDTLQQIFPTPQDRQKLAEIESLAKINPMPTPGFSVTEQAAEPRQPQPQVTAAVPQPRAPTGGEILNNFINRFLQINRAHWAEMSRGANCGGIRPMPSYSCVRPQYLCVCSDTLNCRWLMTCN